jgi:ADP-ribosylglycohydrolase
METKKQDSDNSIRHIPTDLQIRERFRGCLLGGAVGDALRAAVEFMQRSEIVARFGDQGIRDYVPAYGRMGAITDDTQVTLFSAEGMLRGWVRFNERGTGPSFVATTAGAYLRWLSTQGDTPKPEVPMWDPGWLITHRELFTPRAPGMTCVSALRSLTERERRAANDSKGCGGAMRAAPVGMFMSHWSGRGEANIEQTFQVAADIAAVTHGHPTGYLAAGAFAVLIAILIRGGTLQDALAVAKDQLRQREHHEETLQAVDLAETLSRSEPNSPVAIGKLGEGWVAEEALAISIYCASCAKDFEDGVALAVNHDGDSDSTGAIAGNILGCLHGVSRIPGRWLEPRELRELIMEIADDLATAPDWEIGEYSDSPDGSSFCFSWGFLSNCLG